MSSAGKGDKWRKDFNYSKYWENYEKIEANKNPIKHKEIKRLKHQKIRYIY
jgi:hypothetical protein